MADNELPSSMNLDLNLGPIDHQDNVNGADTGSLLEETMNLEDWLNEVPVTTTTRLRDVVHRPTRRPRFRPVWRHLPIPSETQNIAMELNTVVVGGLQTGEGSVAPEGRSDEVPKTCENTNGYSEKEGLGKKDDEEKTNTDMGSFFDCNICLDLSKDPVVTCCGHLFCWSCLYRWLHIHSDARECPVCKGEVTVKNVTPIYGRGSNNTREREEDLTMKIPQRPHAKRVESWRQTIQRTAFAIPMEEMIRRLGSRFDNRDSGQVQPQNAEGGSRGSPERSSLLNRILTSRGMRREHNNVVTSSDDVIDLTESSPTNSEEGRSRRLSMLHRRTSSHRVASISNLTSALDSAERLVNTYFRNHNVERGPGTGPGTGQGPEVPVDDRDSVSSIAAVIHSESQSQSQTLDTAVEIDSNVAISSSSSRRRNNNDNTSRVSDVDTGDSRAPRRRRLH